MQSRLSACSSALTGWSKWHLFRADAAGACPFLPQEDRLFQWPALGVCVLWTKTFSCFCLTCREPSSICLDYRACPFLECTGRWQQQTVHATIGVTRAVAAKRVDARDFARLMKAEHLYAAFGSFFELGGRPYWLIWSKSLPYQAPKAPNNLKSDDGATIRGGTWIIDAYWCESTSGNQERRSYKLKNQKKVDGVLQDLPLSHVPIGSLVQEPDLEFDREGMHDRILGDAAHLNIMRHNFSNVT